MIPLSELEVLLLFCYLGTCGPSRQETSACFATLSTLACLVHVSSSILILSPATRPRRFLTGARPNKLALNDQFALYSTINHETPNSLHLDGRTTTKYAPVNQPISDIRFDFHHAIRSRPNCGIGANPCQLVLGPFNIDCVTFGSD